MSSPMPGTVPPIPPELIGALTSTFANSGGPSHTKIDEAINAAGLRVPRNPSNKSQKVRAAFDAAHPARAQKLVEELVHIIRDGGYYDRPDYAVNLQRAQAAVRLAGGTLTDEGFLTWVSSDASSPASPATPTVAPSPTTSPATATGPLASPVRPNPTAPSAATSGQVVPSVQPSPRRGMQHLPSPSNDRLLSILRRIPAALRPLVGSRRTDQVSLTMTNEYDLQDAVETALRLVYDDVRPEERSPSFAGSSTTPDFLLPETRTAIEVKVTRPGRRNVQIRDEIIIDSVTYMSHPGVDRVVFVVYDLANTITNPAGFESDLSTPINGYPRDTLVVEWPYNEHRYRE